MYELVQVSEKCYYINCPAKIGVYVADKENVYLVDSGNDKDAGRKVRQILDKNGWHLAAILNTPKGIISIYYRKWCFDTNYCTSNWSKI